MKNKPHVFRNGSRNWQDESDTLRADDWHVQGFRGGGGAPRDAIVNPGPHALPAATNDIALVGYFSDGSTAATDTFAFVLLADLSGQTINFTDNGWLSTGAFRTGEGTVSYVVPANTPIGTVITLTGGGNFNLSASGDQIIAYTGTLAAPTAILFALDFANVQGWDATAADTNTSAVPTGLTAGTNALSFALDNGAYSGPLTGTTAQILANIANPANWTTSDLATPTYPGNFTITNGTETQTVVFNPTSVTHAEGDTGTTTYTFTVTRTGGTTGQLDFSGSFAHVTTDATDFDGGTVSPTFSGSILAGQDNATVTITVQGDDIVEGDETFTLSITNATNVAGGVTTVIGANHDATGTITNDDAFGSLSIGDVTLAEGNSGTTAFTFTVLRTGGDDGAVGATWTLNAPGGANLADTVDFAPGQATTGTVSFADGETSTTITILVQGDVTFEPTETFLVTLSAPTGGVALGNANGTGTITNDDPAPAGTLSIDDVSHAEGDSGATTFTFTVSRTGGSAGAVTADYTIAAPGGAGNADSADFVNGSVFTGQVSFADGETSKTITIDVQGDTVFEGNEVFNVFLTNATGGASISDDTGVGTILNDDTAPPAGSVGVADVSIAEGNSGTSILTFTLTRTGGTGPFDVNYATSNGGDPTHASATAGSDYVATSGTAHFADGQTTATVTVTINGDVTAELSEEFTLTLSSPTNGATISDGTAIGTITNDDTPPASINLLTENFDGYLGTGFAPVPTTGQLDSDIYIASGFDDASNPSVAFGGTVTTGDLARGVTAVGVTTGGIYSLDRGSGNHAFWVQPGAADFTPGDFTIRIANTSGVAADTFSVVYDLLVRNDQGRSNSFNLSYSTDGVNFTALTAFNYTSIDAADALGVVTVARSGQFTAASSVAAGGFLYLRFTGDDVGGSGSRDEFGLDNMSVSAVAGTAAPQVAVSDVSVNESAGTMTFTVTRTNAVGGAFSVNYATADGTALAGSDYTATSGMLNFADNQVTATVTVNINNDGTPELDETLFLNLTNPTGGAIITDAQATGTIQNDDGTPIQVSINDVSIAEGDSGTSILTFTVTRTGGSGAFDVNFGTANDSATAGSDYVATSGTLNFAAGQNSQTVSVTINGDTAPEQTEQFFVNLTSATNDAVIVDAQGVGTIVNDEGTFIHDIQGTSYFSPLLAAEGIHNFNVASAAFVTVRAIVTAVDNVGAKQGFYIQEEITDWDGNSFTSEGIFVMTRNDANVGTAVSGVAVGDLVTVTARVMEYQGFSTNMPITALVNPSSIVVNSSGNGLPAYLLDASVHIPSSIFTGVTPDYTDSSDGAGDSFDASLYGLSFWETVEGMLVTVPDMVVADGFVGSSGGRPFLQAYSSVHADPSQINSRGGYTIAGDPPLSPPDTVNPEDGTTNGGRVLHDGDINPDIIEVDWTGFAAAPPAGLSTTASMGDLLGDVTGIIDFDFTDRKLYVTSMEPGGFVDHTPTIETTTFGNDSRSLTVGAFNVENLDPTDGAARFTALANAIANNLHSPDIISIEEMQDNNGAAAGDGTSSTGTDASTTWQMLVDALNLATGAHYQWVDELPTYNAEGGEQSGNIRVGFLYNTDRVQLGDLAADATIAERRQYTDRIGDGHRDAGDLIAFDDSMISAEINGSDWTTTRRSLLGEFTFHGNTVYMTANHWPSKGGSGDVWQFDQNLGSGQPSNSDWTQRNQVAQDVYTMLNYIQQNNANAGILSAGDYNDFYFYRPLEVVTGYVLPDGSARVGGSRFDNLTLTLPEAERYTYAFDGRSQAIDHIIVNGLLSNIASYDVVHLNTGFNPTGTPALSDHDPGLANFDYRNLNEVLVGTNAADAIDGYGGNDRIMGGAGDDILAGGSGTDILLGGANNDTYFVESALDQVIELTNEGSDFLFTSASYVLAAASSVEVLSTLDWTSTEALNLTGNELANIVYGNAGANSLNGGGGADLLIGLGGNDNYFVDNALDQVFEANGAGQDSVFASVSYALSEGSEVEVLSAVSFGATTALNLTGNSLANIVYGNAGVNTLDGGGGADILIGFAGNDIYIVDNTGDVLVEGAGEGFDTAYARADYALYEGSQVEVLSTMDWASTAAMNLTGNGASNYVYGNAGANVLNGGGGADSLTGFGGADSFAFNTALGGGNVDAITDFVHNTDKIALDDAIFTQIGGLGALNGNAFVTGSAAGDTDDRIIYNSATGQLFYDADGNGAGAAVLFATLSGNPTLSASDFVVI